MEFTLAVYVAVMVLGNIGFALLHRRHERAMKEIAESMRVERELFEEFSRENGEALKSLVRALHSRAEGGDTSISENGAKNIPKNSPELFQVVK